MTQPGAAPTGVPSGAPVGAPEGSRGPDVRSAVEPGAVEPDGADTMSRLAQVIAALVLAVVSVLLMVTTHRVTLGVGGVPLPAGLALGAAFQLAASIFLLASTGRRLPLVVLTVAWGALGMVFAGQSAGGGVLMPAVIGDRPQYSGWAVQILGTLIPLLVLAAAWLGRIRRIARARAGRGGRVGHPSSPHGRAS